MTMSYLSRYVLRAAVFAAPLLVAMPASAQTSAADLIVRLERLENQLRQLTGAVEELQYRNQQLEQRLRGAQVEPGPAMRPSHAPPVQQAPTLPARRSDVVEPETSPPAPVTARPLGSGPAVAGGPPVGRPVQPTGAVPRRDVFDPDENPSAPGVPRPLGSGPTFVGTPPPDREAPESAIGAPGGRAAGAPLDLSTLSSPAANDAAVQTPAPSGPLPPPPPRNPSATGPALASVSPSAATPRDEYDLAYGYVLRKDYALAEDGFRTFLRKYPSDRLVPDAHYWLGESMFQRQRYRDAAESFLTVSTKYETTAKAPDALLRLGQSLAALGEREAACAALAEIGRKYPRSSVGVKQGVEREQKRARC
jgi:tol-pal system protein YbgF